ncbi:TetR/AcrR family transcriptional regulator C-terminal domain-containing protein [Frisingicoccus sp.]|uniref:TetR/AcrR family transcriptional regulator C-terminal domain-containing protein n=1 Tax=Frisingicoccus sp. TaxID=1918627 RepID=UPI0015B8D43E
MNQKSQTTEEVLAAGMKHLITVMPFEKITVKAIADEAHVKRPTFYNHFKDKYDIVEYILKQELIEPARTLMACDMLGEAIRLILVTMKKEKKFYMHVARIDEDVIFQRIVRELFKELLLDVMRERMADEDNGNPMLTMDNIAEYYAYGISFGISKWIQKGMKMEVDEVLEALKVLLSESLTDMIYHRNGEQKSVNIV